MALKKARVGLLVAACVCGLAMPTARAAAQDCASLPQSAQRPRACNPQAECLTLIRKDLKGPAVEAARADCARLPTSGTCYGPDRYDPQAECREKRKR